MNDLKDASINNRPVKIEPYCKNPEETYQNVYIINLPDSIATVDDLKKLFEDYGEVESSKLVFDENGKSRGFGYCNFRSHESAVAAVEALNKKVLDGKELSCNRVMPRKERDRFLKEQTEKWRREIYEKYKGRNLYVRNFDESLTEDELREVFSQFGDIESA